MGASYYSEDVKLRGKQLYLQGFSLNECAKRVAEWTGKKCSASLFRKWAIEGKWGEEQRRSLAKVNTSLTEDTTSKMIQRAKEQLEAYQSLIDRGVKALSDKTVTVDKISEVVSLVDVGIKGERQISQGLVSWKYVEEVVKIICEEIHEEELRRRIARRLQNLTTDLLSV